MHSYTIRNERVRDNLIEEIKSIDIEKKLKRVTIADHVNSKSAQQRGFFHKLCALFGDEVGMQPGEVKEIAKAKLFGWNHIEYGGVTLTLAAGHSEELNSIEYGELIDIVYQLAGDAGIQLPPPDRYRRDG